MDVEAKIWWGNSHPMLYLIYLNYVTASQLVIFGVCAVLVSFLLGHKHLQEMAQVKFHLCLQMKQGQGNLLG